MRARPGIQLARPAIQSVQTGTIVRGPAMGQHPACAQAVSLCARPRITDTHACAAWNPAWLPAGSITGRKCAARIMCAVRHLSSVAARPRYHVAARPGFKLLQSILSASVAG